MIGSVGVFGVGVFGDGAFGEGALWGAGLAAAAGWLVWGVPATRRWHQVTGSPRSRWRPSKELVVGLVAGLLAAIVAGPGALLVVAPPAALFTRWYGNRVQSGPQRRRSEQIARQSPLALDLLGAALAAGRPPVSAFAAVAANTADPLGSELAAVAHRLEVATDPSMVWRQLCEGPIGPVGRAFVRTEASGLAVARVISEAAADLRREQDSARQEAAERLTVTSTIPLGLCFLPAFFLVSVVPMLMGLVGGALAGLR